MTGDIPTDDVPLLVELVEKVGLLRRDMQRHGDADRYAARLARVEQKLTALATRFDVPNPEIARALRTAWHTPAMSLAFRNAEHRKP